MSAPEVTPRLSLDAFGDDDVLTPEESASVLRVSVDKTWDLARSGALKSVRAGRSVRIRVGDLREFIRDGGSR